MPARGWGEVMPVKREMAPPWEKPPRTMREEDMPLSISSFTRALK